MAETPPKHPSADRISSPGNGAKKTFVLGFRACLLPLLITLLAQPAMAAKMADSNSTKDNIFDVEGIGDVAEQPVETLTFAEAVRQLESIKPVFDQIAPPSPDQSGIGEISDTLIARGSLSPQEKTFFIYLAQFYKASNIRQIQKLMAKQAFAEEDYIILIPVTKTIIGGMEKKLDRHISLNLLVMSFVCASQTSPAYQERAQQDPLFKKAFEKWKDDALMKVDKVKRLQKTLTDLKNALK